MARAAKTAAIKRPVQASAGGKSAPVLGPPPFRAVQLATLVDAVPAGDRWLHEMKYDGYRTLVSVGAGEARAYTRSGLDWSDRFPSILMDAAKLKVRSALIDGEAVVLDANGKSSFQALQGALKGAPATIDYFAFDLLELDGQDLTGLPLIERKKKLRAIVPPTSEHLRYSDHIQGNGEKLLNSFCQAGLEGVVSKHHAADLPAPATSTVAISNRDRVIYPESSITKGQLADHYAAVAGIMLPWVGSRPISLVRCPQGRAKKCFFQKHDAGSFGDAVHHVGVIEKDGHEELYLYIDDADGLLTCVQMGTIEFHGWGARTEDVEKADRLVFDLDPDEGLDFENVRAAAFQFRDILKSIGLETFPMVTGGKGVHVIAPLTPRAEWPEVKDFAHRLAQAVAQSDPEHFTAALPKVQRKGRIFVDYLRNQRGATAVMPYSARARPNAPVAAPITWKEMETIASPAHFHIGDAAELVKRAGSQALSGWGRADQELPDL